MKKPQEKVPQPYMKMIHSPTSNLFPQHISPTWKYQYLKRRRFLCGFFSFFIFPSFSFFHPLSVNWKSCKELKCCFSKIFWHCQAVTLCRLQLVNTISKWMSGTFFNSLIPHKAPSRRVVADKVFHQTLFRFHTVFLVEWD